MFTWLMILPLGVLSQNNKTFLLVSIDEKVQFTVNLDGDTSVYKREIIKVSSTDKLSVHLSNGGGWAARIYKSK